MTQAVLTTPPSVWTVTLDDGSERLVDPGPQANSAEGALAVIAAESEAQAAAMDQFKARTLDDFVAWLDVQALGVTGQVPAAEKLTYDAKEAAALRIQAGTATPADLSLIAIEAALVGEAPETTVEKILTNAALFRVAGPLIAGLRRRAQAAIAAAATPAEADQAVIDVQRLYVAALADPHVFAADPAAWLA